ncbi:hypothetical protein L7F22_000411 [Adiantum nelumboides]|nr:hypothetical protein [Adiantum nelumboides]
MEVLENVVLDAETKTFLFIGTLPGFLGVEVACTDFLDVKSIVDLLKQDRCFEHVDQSCASLCATHESPSADEVESHAYDEVLSFDDVNLHEESCASSIMKVDSFAYMCGKESNVIACLDPCLDNCRDEGLSSSMCWSYMPEKDFCCDVEDMHAIILDDVFLPPSDALSRYPDELWVRGPVWDAEMDSDHVRGIVGGTKVPTGDSFDCNQNMACSQNEDYGTFVVDDDDDGWGFDEPLIEDNLSMASYVQKAQERLRNLKIQKQAEKTQHVLEKAHSIDVLSQDFEPHAGNKAEADIMADMDTMVLMDVCDGREAMKTDMDVMFDKMLIFLQIEIFQVTSRKSVIEKPMQPSLWVQVLQVGIAMFVMDTWQYFVHRYMHVNRFLYRHVHSQHHRLVVPYAIGALYNHPLEGLLLDTVGGAISFLVSGMTPKTSVFFFSFAVIKTVDDHCGLRLPGNPFHMFFKNNTAYHDIHHQLLGTKYNFSQPFFMMWDKYLGTYMPFTLVKRLDGGFEARPVKRDA